MRRGAAAAAAVIAAAAALLFGGPSGTSADAAPRDARAAALRGFAALERARVAVDPLQYDVAERELHEALRLGGADPLALRGLASLAAARHRFDESLELAERARRLSPSTAAAYGLIGDAKVELGRYEEGFAAFDRMAELKPGPAAYARISYARELRGDTAGAISAMRLAADSARPGEPRAWALTHVANLLAGTGRRAAARRIHEDVLAVLPAYAPALGGLAELAFAAKRYERAAALYERALALVSSPEYAVGLGNASLALGRRDAAERAFERARELEEEFAHHGGRNELETALLDLDLDRDLRDALRRARRGASLRPSVEGEHVLAWALYKNGRCAEARRHSVRALRLGTKDVGALYHRHLIERCLGDAHAADAFLRRVVAIDATFLNSPPSAYRLP